MFSEIVVACCAFAAGIITVGLVLFIRAGVRRARSGPEAVADDPVDALLGAAGVDVRDAIADGRERMERVVQRLETDGELDAEILAYLFGDADDGEPDAAGTAEAITMSGVPKSMPVREPELTCYVCDGAGHSSKAHGWYERFLALT